MKKIVILFLILILCAQGCSSEESSGSPSPSSSASPSSSSGSSSSSGIQGGSSDSEKTGIISASGSTALQPLLTQAVGTFTTEKKFKGTVTVSGGGSVQGITDVAAGKVDIGLSDISPQQAGKDGTGLVDNQIAVVAVGVAVSTDVASNMKEISTSDLKGIYTGKITDWKEVAGWKGVSTPITVYYEKSGSGIRYLFDNFGINTVLDNAQLKTLKNFIEIESPGKLQKDLENGKGGIGYAALPYCSKLKLLKIDGTEAAYESVYSGKYKIWGCEHMYTMGEPTGAAKSFIEYLTSQDFQKAITAGGYGIISEMKVSR
jgi:phosphate transport system substrate-binding protein